MFLHSLVLGLVAWALGVAAIAKVENNLPFVIGSFAACCLSALTQFFEIQKRVAKGDISGLIDTIDAIVFGAVVMIAVTVILNLMAWSIKKRAEQK